jgi:hypothetical protein
MQSRRGLSIERARCSDPVPFSENSWVSSSGFGCRSVEFTVAAHVTCSTFSTPFHPRHILPINRGIFSFSSERNVLQRRTRGQTRRVQLRDWWRRIAQIVSGGRRRWPGLRLAGRRVRRDVSVSGRAYACTVYRMLLSSIELDRCVTCFGTATRRLR